MRWPARALVVAYYAMTPLAAGTGAYIALHKPTHEVPTAQTKLGDDELFEKATAIARGIRDAMAESSMREERLSEMRWSKISKLDDGGVDRAKMQASWDATNAAIDRESLGLMQLYMSGFKTDAIITRDDLLARLPADIRWSPDRSHVNTSYVSPVNPFMLEAVASDLELLAKRLPGRDH